MPVWTFRANSCQTRAGGVVCQWWGWMCGNSVENCVTGAVDSSISGCTGFDVSAAFLCDVIPTTQKQSVAWFLSSRHSRGIAKRVHCLLPFRQFSSVDIPVPQDMCYYAGHFVSSLLFSVSVTRLCCIWGMLVFMNLWTIFAFACCCKIWLFLSVVSDTAFAKNAYDGNWYNFDDSSVAATDAKNIVVSA